MIRILLSILLFFLLPQSSAAQEAPQNLEPKIARIVGGGEAQPGAWPWMAALVYRGYDLFSGQFCGGTLIHGNWVVTAAHCVLSESANDIQIVLGAHNLDTDSDTAEWLNVSEIIIHPNYDRESADFDLALLRLNKSSSYQPTWLLKDDSSFVNALAATLGWGLTNPDDWGSYPAELNQVSVPIVSQETCRAAYSQSEVTDNMICAGYAEGGKDTCFGDSGGPLVVDDGGEWKLIGIISWGEGCALPGYYGVNTRVSSLYDFVTSYVPEPTIIDPPPTDQNTSFGLWNGFLEMTNILELVNDSDNEVQVQVYMFIRKGTVASVHNTSIEPRAQKDIILNSLQGFMQNSYGLVAVRGAVKGRVLNYRALGPGFDNFEFSFRTSLSSPEYGPTYVAFNTYNPSSNPNDSNNLVANWLSVVSLSGEPKSFTVKKYDFDGQSLPSTTFTLESYRRNDVEGGHKIPGPHNSGLLEISPQDVSAPYLAQLVRYAYGSSDTFDFAFPLDPFSASSGPLHVPISSMIDTQNWIEVVNVSNENADISVVLYDQSGTALPTSSFRLARQSGQHVNASRLLGAPNTGHARITSSKENSIITQSLFYTPSASGSTAAAYASPGRIASTQSAAGSYNLFLQMQNYLKLINTSSNAAQVQLEISSLSSPGSLHSYTLPPYASLDLALHDTAFFGTALDTYGAVLLTPQNSAAVLSEVIRLRYSPSTEDLEYIVPTKVSVE